MTSYVVFLRAINVGGHNKIPMAELRELMTDLGFGEVTTLLQTGNVIVSTDWSAAQLAERAKAAIAERFGHDIEVMVRTAAELAELIDGFPYAEADPKQSGVVFLDGARTGPLDASTFTPDECTLVGDAVYVNCPTGFAKTKLSNAWVEKQTGFNGTRRNWNTVLKLAELAERHRLDAAD